MHSVALLLVLNVPLAHAAHTRSAVAEPALAMNCPAAHDDLGTHAVAGLLSSSHVSLAHATAGFVPPEHVVPAVHVVQLGFVPVVPAGQSFVPTHVVWLTPEVFVFAAHGVHPRSLVTVGSALTYVPALQLLHAEHADALVVAL